jgi:hypothetical protein
VRGPVGHRLTSLGIIIGLRGIYQHCAEKHLHRYLAEYDFRYNNRVALGVNDGERAARAIVSASGKRLTYRQPYKT